MLSKEKLSNPEVMPTGRTKGKRGNRAYKLGSSSFSDTSGLDQRGWSQVGDPTAVGDGT